MASTSSQQSLPPDEPHRITKLVYFVRHAEAVHNVKEQEAVARARRYSNGDREIMEQARKAVLQDESLRDAPLSPPGVHQVRQSANRLQHLYQQAHYPCPQLVLVSPLRRTLMTATELFLHEESNKTNDPTQSHRHSYPQFQALEILREKRTGFAADERRSTAELTTEFPHVIFEDEESTARPLSYPTPPMGENNAQVQDRARVFVESFLQYTSSADTIAVVSHKGWLRELRHVLKEWVLAGRIHVDFDLQAWDETLYGNAEIRVVQMTYEERMDKDQDDSNSGGAGEMMPSIHTSFHQDPLYKNYHLVSIVSRGVEGLLHGDCHDRGQQQQKTLTPTATFCHHAEDRNDPSNTSLFSILTSTDNRRFSEASSSTLPHLKTRPDLL